MGRGIDGREDGEMQLDETAAVGTIDIWNGSPRITCDTTIGGSISLQIHY
jgi:hypothetical protein